MRISYWSSDVGSSDLLARGDVAGKAALRAGHDLVADADVGEGAPHHDLVIAAAGAVGVELPRRHLVLGEVGAGRAVLLDRARRSEEHTSELQSLMCISYAVFCLKKKHKVERTL